MSRMLIARLTIGGVAICAGGGVTGIGLANFVELGSFHFYKQPRIAEWRPSASSTPTSDVLAFSDMSTGAARRGPDARPDR